MRLPVVVVPVLAGGLLALLASCGGDDAPVDSGASDAVVDARSDRDADGDSGPPALGPRGCFVDADCASGACFHPLAELGRGVGYCTVSCETDTDCASLEEDAFTYACIRGERNSSRCLRVCPHGYGCPDGHVCATGAATGDGNRADVCVDLSEDACAADADCDEDSFCRFLLADQEKVAAGCFTPLDAAGRPAEGLRAGQVCDPRSNVHDYAAIECSDAADCPAGWSCRAMTYTDSLNHCTPPPAESCVFSRGRISGFTSEFYCRDPRFCGCLDEGRCGGLCATDEDCGPSMRCSLATISALLHGSAYVYDDTQTTARFCTYAEGSRTPCARETDCAATGALGGPETCKVSTDGAGAPSGICVTPPAGVGLPGDPCGDDPATPEIDHRPCINACIGGACAAACASDADCGGGGQCLLHELDQAVSAGMCTPGLSCARDADCSEGLVCQLVTTAEGGVARCAPPRGLLAAGQQCPDFMHAIERGPEARCASLSCEEEVCTTLCAVDADCPADFRCVDVTRTTNGRGTLARDDDVTATYRACERSAGSGRACATEGDCDDFESCLATVVDGVPENVCVENLGPGGVGERCSAECATHFPCVIDYLTYNDYCTATCTTDSDCGATDLVCRRFLDDRLGVDWRLCVERDDPRGQPL